MPATMLREMSNLLASAADGRWMGCDYVLALVAATFPAWTLVTLVRGWACGRGGRVPVVAEAVEVAGASGVRRRRSHPAGGGREA